MTTASMLRSCEAGVIGCGARVLPQWQHVEATKTTTTRKRIEEEEEGGPPRRSDGSRRTAARDDEEEDEPPGRDNGSLRVSAAATAQTLSTTTTSTSTQWEQGAGTEVLGAPVVAPAPGLSASARTEALLSLSRLEKKSKPVLMALCSGDGLVATGTKKEMALRLTSKMFPGFVVVASGTGAAGAPPKAKAPVKIAIVRGDSTGWTVLSLSGVNGRAIYEPDASLDLFPESGERLAGLVRRVEEVEHLLGTAVPGASLSLRLFLSGADPVAEVLLKASNRMHSDLRLDPPEMSLALGKLFDSNLHSTSMGVKFVSPTRDDDSVTLKRFARIVHSLTPFSTAVGSDSESRWCGASTRPP